MPKKTTDWRPGFRWAMPHICRCNLMHARTLRSGQSGFPASRRMHPNKKKEVLLRTGGIPLLFTAPVVQWIEQLSPKE